MIDISFRKVTGIALITIVSGCSSVANYKTNDSQLVGTSNMPADQIEVFSSEKIGKKYRVLGGVVSSADAGSDASTSVNLLKKEAFKLGADAIVDLRLSIDQGYWTNAITSTGTAIAFEE